MTIRRVHSRLRRALSRLHTSDRGLTLVEMVVALGIITTILLAAGSALVAIQSAQRTGEATDRATQIANDRIEQARLIAWNKVGTFVAIPATVTMPYASETQVTLTGTAPTVLSAAEVNESVGANTFKVYTRVSWAPNTDTTLSGVTGPYKDTRNNTTGVQCTPLPCTSDGINDDSAKRVTIQVQWTDGNKSHSINASTLRYPTIAESIPSTLEGRGSAVYCNRPSASAFCTVRATSGLVMALNGGAYKTSQDVTVAAVTKAVNSAVSARIGATTYVLDNPSGDGVTWTKKFPPLTILPLGPQSILFTAAAGTDTLTDVNYWAPLGATAPAIKPAVGTTWVGTNPGSLRSDPGHTDPLVDPHGGENSTNDFCVKADGTLWNYQVLYFDVTGNDDQDGPATDKPTVTYTGAYNPSNLASAMSKTILDTHIGHPDWAVTGASTTAAWGTGEVTPYSTAAGALNARRWHVAFAAGTRFHADTTQSVITISQTRPGDGTIIQDALTIPLRVTADADTCNVTPPNPPTGLAASATGTTVSLTWAPAARATSYKVYWARQNTPTDPLTYTLATTTSATSFTTAAAAGQRVTFKVTGVNEHGDSTDSTTASADTVPVIPPGTVTTEYGNYWGLYENTQLSQDPPWTLTTKLYRSANGAGLTYLMDGTTYGDGKHFFNRGGSPGPAPGYDYMYSVAACNDAGCSPRKLGPVMRVPLWYGLFGTGGGTIFDWAPVPTTYGGTGAYDFANTYNAGADITFGQPAAFGMPGEARSMLFAPTGNLRQFASYTPGPGTNAPRAVGFMYKESGTFTAGWLFGRAGTTLTNGFSAKNTAAGTIVMNGTTAASWTGLKVNDGAWHYYIASYDGTNVTLYEDGVNKGAKALAVNTPTTSDLTYNWADGQSPTSGVSGSYAWMNYWPRAITAAEALDFYNARMDP